MQQQLASLRAHRLGCSRPRHQGSRARSRRPLVCRNLGFDFGEPRDEPEPVKQIRARSSALTSLPTKAASLLVLAPVMRGTVAEALLAMLALSVKYQASNSAIIGAYAKFYGLLLQSGYGSWLDYVLDNLLLGRDSALARAVAQGEVEKGAPVLRALAHDLDKLQDIAVDMEELAAYVVEVAPTAGSVWAEAASSSSLKPPPKQGSEQGRPTVVGININTPSRFIQRPASPEELNQWKEALMSKRTWGEAAPILHQYYHLHGFGITSRHSALRWSKGGFEEATEGALACPPRPPLSVQQPLHDVLAANTLRHCEGPGGEAVLIAGPSGSGKSWLLHDCTLAAGKERGLRVVCVSASEILEAARGCARYPRVRFILLADNLELPLRGDTATDIMLGLSGVGLSGWPSNTLLYAAATPTSTVTQDDPVVAAFGLTLTTEHPAVEPGLVAELASARMGGKAVEGEALSQMQAAAARALPAQAPLRDVARVVARFLP